MSSPTLPAFRHPRYGAFAVSLTVAWILLALLALGLRRGAIQHDLSRRADAAVAQLGPAGARVTYQGRDATLHGTFADAAQAERARRAVAGIDGTRSATLAPDVRVSAAPRPAPATPPAAPSGPAVAAPVRPLVVAVDGSALTVTATVPDAASRRALLTAVAGLDAGTVSATITVTPGVGRPATAALPALARALATRPDARAGGARVTLTATTVRLDGPVATAAERTALVSAVRTAVGGRLTVDDRLTVGSGPAPAPGTTAAERAVAVAAIGAGPVRFATGSAALTAADRAELAGVAAALRAGELTVLVAGNTDATGAPAVNWSLAAARAAAAAGYLRALGVPADRIRTAAYGARRPLGSNATATGRAANRRVDLTVVTSSG